MPAVTIARRRLYQQHLLRDRFKTPDEVVAASGAVQAQDYMGAKWALGLRMQNATDDSIEQAFNAGSILRTHVMRPTWHFVTPSDIRWLLALTAARVNAANAHIYRQSELDDALFVRTNKVIAQALEGGRHLTRAELGSALKQAGIPAAGVRLGYIIMRAELDAVLCSGPRRGKQFTYALLDERAPHAKILERELALAELTQRYYMGHGPATIRDLIWWSGLTVADAKAGIEMAASHLTHESIDGQTYWFSTSASLEPESTRAAFLLPTYDEFLVGYASFDETRRAGHAAGELFNSPIVVGGQIVGSWKRTLKKDDVVVALAPFTTLTAAKRQAITFAAQRYADFLGRRLVLAWL